MYGIRFLSGAKCTDSFGTNKLSKTLNYHLGGYATQVVDRRNWMRHGSQIASNRWCKLPG